MNPQSPQPDLQALALTKAIRQRETGSHPNAYTASGDNATSTGAYQFQPDTWKNYAKTVLGDANAQMSEANQNAVAYGMIKTWKDQGLGPAQIAAKWNSGSENGWENKVGTTTRGGKPLAYNVPEYVKSVVDNFKTIYPQVSSQYGQPSGGGNPLAPEHAYADTGSMPPPTSGDPKQDALSKLTGFFNAIFPGKQVGEAIGTLAGYGISKAQGTSDQYDTSAPTPLQTLGDVAQGALAVAPGMPKVGVFGKTVSGITPAASAFGRIAQGVGLGAGLGATGSLAKGETSIGEIAKDAATTAAIGGVFGVAGEGISKILGALPKRIAQNALKINPKTLEQKPGLIDKALKDVSFGTKGQMEAHSQMLLDTYDDSIKAILKSPEFHGVSLNGKTATEMVVEAFPDSNLDITTVKKIVKQVAPEASGLVDRFVAGGLDMFETNRLRELLDKATRSFYTRNAVPPFSKEVTVEMANILRNAIQGGAEETAPIFEKYTREIAIHSALQKIKQAPSFKINFNDLIKAFIFDGGTGAGIIPTIVGQEVLQNKAVQLNTAKAITKVAPAVTGTIKAAAVPTMVGTSR